MTAVVEIAKESIAAVWELQWRNTQAIRAIAPGDSGFDDLIADASLQLRNAATDEAPRITGTLASAHRSMLAGAGTGVVFVDPAVRNPVSGGNPAVYGQDVDKRNPWLGRTIQMRSPQILGDVGEKLFARLDRIYRN